MRRCPAAAAGAHRAPASQGQGSQILLAGVLEVLQRARAASGGVGRGPDPASARSGPVRHRRQSTRPPVTSSPDSAAPIVATPSPAKRTPGSPSATRSPQPMPGTHSRRAASRDRRRHHLLAADLPNDAVIDVRLSAGEDLGDDVARAIEPGNRRADLHATQVALREDALASVHDLLDVGSGYSVRDVAGAGQDRPAPACPDPQRPARRPQRRTSQKSLPGRPRLRGQSQLRQLRHRQHFADALTRGTPPPSVCGCDVSSTRPTPNPRARRGRTRPAGWPPLPP